MSAPKSCSAIPVSTTVEAAQEIPVFQRNFLAHLKEYPLVNSTKEAVYTLPYTKKVISSFTPTLKSIRDTQPIRSIVDKGDAIADGALNQMDKMIPKLKTLEAHELTDPVTRPINGAIEGIQSSINEVNGTLHKTVVDPTTKAVDDLKKCIHCTIFDKDGKAIIPSQADPVVAPFNENLEKFVETHFPKIKKVKKETCSSEIARAIKIIFHVCCRTKVVEPVEACSTQVEQVTVIAA